LGAEGQLPTLKIGIGGGSRRERRRQIPGPDAVRQPGEDQAELGIATPVLAVAGLTFLPGSPGLARGDAASQMAMERPLRPGVRAQHLVEQPGGAVGIAAPKPGQGQARERIVVVRRLLEPSLVGPIGGLEATHLAEQLGFADPGALMVRVFAQNLADLAERIHQATLAGGQIDATEPPIRVLWLLPEVFLDEAFRAREVATAEGFPQRGQAG
jgi:hypothetical protein